MARITSSIANHPIISDGYVQGKFIKWSIEDSKFDNDKEVLQIETEIQGRKRPILKKLVLNPLINSKKYDGKLNNYTSFLLALELITKDTLSNLDKLTVDDFQILEDDISSKLESIIESNKEFKVKLDDKKVKGGKIISAFNISSFKLLV